jgi:polyhydroxybutyrate depolymerase
MTARHRSPQPGHGWLVHSSSGSVDTGGALEDLLSERRDRLVWILGGAVALLALVVGALVVILLARDDSDTTSAPTTTRTAPAPTTTARPTGPAAPVRPTSTVPTRYGPVGLRTFSLQEGIVRREYLVMTPVSSPEDERLPSVMVLHGLGVDHTAMTKADDWPGAVARDRFLAVFPQGILNSWNAGPCCPPASLLKVDDVGFLSRVVAQLVRRPDVDPARLYLTGFSNGGIMTYAMACARPKMFAAVAPMAGTNVMGCKPASPVPLLHLHGDPDPTVPYDGRVTASQLLSTADFPPVPESVAAWAAADGCDADPTVTTAPGPVTTARWGGCRDDSKVELVTYPGNGHSWPTAPLNGLDELLRFFDLQR